MDTIKLTPDFKEFVSLLNSNSVEYLLVGGYAVNHYGYIRYTGDMDIWVGQTPENAEKLSTSLQKFGFSPESVPAEKFLRENAVFQMGVPPFRIDILTSISGLDFSTSYAKQVISRVEDIQISVICLEDLKANKLASGRPKDLSDVDYFTRKPPKSS